MASGWSWRFATGCFLRAANIASSNAFSNPFLACRRPVRHATRQLGLQVLGVGLKHFEVLWSVVCPHSVSVMHNFIAPQVPPERCFCDEPMLKHIAPLGRQRVRRLVPVPVATNQHAASLPVRMPLAVAGACSLRTQAVRSAGSLDCGDMAAKPFSDSSLLQLFDFDQVTQKAKVE